MTKMKMKKAMALLLAMMMVFAVPLSASAAEVQDVADNPSTSLSAPDIEPRGFDAHPTVSLTTSYQLVRQDDNWWGERTVYIKMEESRAPTSVSVYVLDKDGNSLGTRTLYLSQSTTYTLPVGGGAFGVYAKRVGGYNGDVTFHIKLS